ncbi:phosphatidate cytidylyltransferase [Mesonia ostreae]|uniref:Phosphatidate cytidylyltransferase n=1 Tax=Mesonia ostreae TaxID=861110 RepID=A0ABU2KL11_9FLAO|nr:phosphatidate cytidylyltransferase [Mesonia ostreae]MDT0295417.1 phosphatidate cytidylyltransferase [Mesonia ostreae]
MKETLTRTLSGALYIVILIAAVLVSKFTFWGLFLIFGLICVHELQKLLKLNSYLSYALLIIFFAFFSIFQFNIYVLNILLVLTLLVKILLLRDLIIVRKIPLFQEKKYIVVIFYLIASFIFISLIPFDKDGTYQPNLLIAIFVLIWVNDTFAYLVGKNFGRNKLFERVSPNKTIEGFLGGLFFSIVAGYVISLYIPIFTYGEWIVLSILVSIFGTYGDLIQSRLKRQAKVKDSGSIMPGHGGLLDRLDSVLFASTFVYTYLLFI